MTFAISEALDKQLVVLAVALVGLVELIKLRMLKGIKKDTTQVNNAVNHVEPGKKPLTQRVDKIEEDVHTLHYKADVMTRELGAVSNRSEKNSEKIDETKELVRQLFDVVPKRKDDLDGGSNG